jgi:hypothetical protein
MTGLLGILVIAAREVLVNAVHTTETMCDLHLCHCGYCTQCVLCSGSGVVIDRSWMNIPGKVLQMVINM